MYQEPEDDDAGGDERSIDEDIISTQKITENKEESVKKAQQDQEDMLQRLKYNYNIFAK